MATILLIRHAEPELRGVLLGQLDPPLSESGRAQARGALADIRSDIIWTSPLRRARETAALLSPAPIHELPELCEIDMGEWTGMTWQQAEHSHGELARQKLVNWFGVAAPGGESWSAFVTRVGRAWNLIRSGPANGAVIAHQGVNAALCSLIEGCDPIDFQQEYCEVISLEYNRLD